ncbi:MAG: 2-succinyl-5-enolpyruvyl-6-hydroxy-3-cyclohexene-1-carboxylic-acid synthase, partial [Deltaproteobacteria bacterium]|nr:2-succinyl-5-enolpyruvyl-6-hydroxy-3-cyclohexene-1-carboxylic-acid synthase [Deltaproteobacteria bacterium]
MADRSTGTQSRLAGAGANRNTLWATVFVEELARSGVCEAVISPGSRSTPLTLALAAHDGIKTYNIIDERGAGFFALGLAKTAGRPVALVCTSGTAAANYLPAVQEASLSRVPLLALTADRPPLLRDAGAAQTIDQLKLFGDGVRWFAEVGEPVMAEEDLRRLRSLAARAVYESCRLPPGPVHLNFPFRKPLEPREVPGDVPAELLAACMAHEQAAGAGAYLAGVSAPPPPLEASLAEKLAGDISAAERGLIICGPRDTVPRRTPGVGEGSWEDPTLDWEREGEALAALAAATGYPVLTEPPAGLHAGSHDKSNLVPHADSLLRGREFRDWLLREPPELILRFGSMPTLMPVERLLKEHPSCPVITVNPSGAWLSPTHHGGLVIQADPALFSQGVCQALKALRSGGTGKADTARTAWRERFTTAGRRAGEALAEAMAALEQEGQPWFEGRVFSELAPLLPQGCRVFTASSMPVRDLASFTPLTPARVRYLVSRGANGIDGTLSTALGMAAAPAGDSPANVLVTGDLALLHDANALAAAARHRLPLLVVLVNNDGGGIF